MSDFVLCYPGTPAAWHVKPEDMPKIAFTKIDLVDHDTPNGCYLQEQQGGPGYQVVLIGSIPYPPTEYEAALSALRGSRVELIESAAMTSGKPHSRKVLRRGFWRMIFWPAGVKR